MTDEAEAIYERLLVVRAQAGDEAAFAELIERYSPKLRYFLRKLLPSSEGEEDALQDVWLDALRGLSRLVTPAAWRTWLYRLARDRAFLRLRKRKHVEQPLDEQALATCATEEITISADEAAAVHAALDRLPTEQREVLVLRFLEDLSYEEIARIVGCQLGTVRSRLHYGKQALRKVLDSSMDLTRS